VRYGQVLLATGDYEGARAAVTPVLDVPDAASSGAWGVLALADANLGLDDEAREAIAAALAIGADPNASKAQELLDRP
jgi:predicted Zn-dependent protease